MKKVASSALALRPFGRAQNRALSAVGGKKLKNHFDWSDPFLMHSQLTEDEQLIATTARDYVKSNLLTRVIQANRNETFDPKIMEEMGNLGFLGCTICEDPRLKIKVHMILTALLIFLDII
jgi:hypothetical protein